MEAASVTCWEGVHLQVLLRQYEQPFEKTVDKAAVKQLVVNVRTLVMRAKEGMLLNLLHREIAQIRDTAVLLAENTTGSVLEISCGTNQVIKQAAAATGSHEILNLLLANDTISVTNGRLSLSLAMLELVAQQVIDELTMTDEIGPQLSALIFVADTALYIIDLADETVTSSLTSSSTMGQNEVDLGYGFSHQGNQGVGWKNVAGHRKLKLGPNTRSISRPIIDVPFVDSKRAADVLNLQRSRQRRFCFGICW